MGVAPDKAKGSARLIGRALERFEDAALLVGRGRYADDLPVPVGTLHAAILRSPHAHAEIAGIDASAALAMPGVVAVITGADVRRWTEPFVVGVKQPMEHWCLAMERVRFVGEPVAVVLAADRYRAEDALDQIGVDYRGLPAVVDPLIGDRGRTRRSCTPRWAPTSSASGPSVRRSRGGLRRCETGVSSLAVDYPRNSCTPIECFVVLADWNPAGDYEVMANFQGPLTIHPVMALALNVAPNRLRLRTPPDSGGSFGVKQAIFPYIVLMAVAARIAGRPVKWVEDRLEHLVAANSATNRVSTIEAAVRLDGTITALRWDQLEDCGAYLRAPEPATLYRMHGNMTGAYAIRHLAIRNRVVLTNKTPTGLNRGFGGPQVYFALERLMREWRSSSASILSRSSAATWCGPAPFLIAAPPERVSIPATIMQRVDRAIEQGGLDELKRLRDRARAEGRLYGIGFAAVVEPSISNMGYITTVLTAGERRAAGPKSGAQATATCLGRPAGRCQCRRRFAAAGPGTSHGAGAGRRRRARP